MRSLLIISLFFLSVFNSYSNDVLNQGKYQLEISNFAKAKEHFSEIIEERTSLKVHDSILAYAYVYRGKSNQLLETYDLALSDYYEGLGLFGKINNYSGEVFALVSIAEFHRNISEFEKSLEYLEKANDLYLNHDISSASITYMYNRYAAIYSEIGIEIELVKEFSKKVIELAKASGNKVLEASSLTELGFLYEKEDNTEAEEYYKKALVLFKEIGDRYNECLVFRNLARVYANNSFDNNRTQNHEQAVIYADKGIELADTSKWFSLKVSLFDIKYRSLVILKKHEKAMIAMEHYADNLHKELDNELNKSLFEIDAKYRATEKDNRILIAEKKNYLLNNDNESKTIILKFSIVISLLLASLFAVSIFFYFKIKRVNSQLLKSVKQKEIFLQEVHHRVKNNLTTLDSLLYLQAKSCEDLEVKYVLNECQSRVHSMALVHQNLYDVEDASKVDLKTFVNQLVVESASIFNFPLDKFTLELETKNISFDMGFAIFIGLILNELITNSFKYAFNIDDENKISIIFNENSEEYSFTYHDYGQGLDKDFNIENSKGFGFKLIRIMLNQINGKIVFDHKSKTFLIKFKNGEKI